MCNHGWDVSMERTALLCVFSFFSNSGYLHWDVGWSLGRTAHVFSFVDAVLPTNQHPNDIQMVVTVVLTNVIPTKHTRGITFRTTKSSLLSSSGCPISYPDFFLSRIHRRTPSLHVLLCASWRRPMNPKEVCDKRWSLNQSNDNVVPWWSLSGHSLPLNAVALRDPWDGYSLGKRSDKTTITSTLNYNHYETTFF